MIKSNQQFIVDTMSQLRSSKLQETDFLNIKNFPLNSKQALYVIDWQEGKLTYQRGIEKLLGYSKEEFTLLNILNMAHPDDLNLVKRVTQAAINHVINLTEFTHDETFLLFIYRYKKKNGSYLKIMRQSTVFEKTEDGKMKSNLSLLTDVSFFDKANVVTWDFVAPQIEKDAFRDSIYKEFTTLFTKRESEIIPLIADNLTTKDIAEQLYVSEHTVQSHRKNILRKSNCHNAQELILFCHKVGVLK